MPRASRHRYARWSREVSISPEAIDFLFAHSAYPALYGMREVAVAEPLASEATGSNTMDTQIIPNAAAFLGEIGTGFMDD